MPLSPPNTFKPPRFNIAFSVPGDVGKVLTVQADGSLAFATGGGGGGSNTLGARLPYASPAGGAVAAAPAGFSSSIGRLIVTLPGGNATWASLTAGTDGQLLVIINNDAANTLILPASAFPGVGDLNLNPGNRALLYFDSTDALWERTSP